MPVVPVSGGQSVEQRPLPFLKPSLETFGGGQAQTPVDLSGPAHTALGIYQQEKFKADQTAVVDAGSKVSAAETDILRNPDSGVLNTRGKDAQGAIDTARQKWDQSMADIAAGLTNDNQKSQFQQWAKTHWASIDAQVQSHMANEAKTYAAEATSSLLTNEQNAATASAITDPRRAELAIGNQTDAIKLYAAANGWSDDQLQEHIQANVSKTRFGVFQQLLNTPEDKGGGDLKAQSYLAAHRAEFVGPELQQADRQMEAGSVLGESQRRSQQIASTATSLTAALDEARKIDDPRIQEATDQQVRRIFADRATADRQAKAEAFQKASAIVEQTGDFDQVPMAMRVNMSPEENGALSHRADQIRNPIAITNQDVKATLLNAAGLHPDKFAALDLTAYKDQLSAKDYSALQSKQLSARLSAKRADDATTRHDTYAAEAEGRRTQHQAEADARAKTKADAKAKAAEIARNKLLHDMGITLTPKVPGAALPPKPQPGGAALPLKPAVPEEIQDLQIPDSWKDEAAENPDYLEYLSHHSL